MQSVSNYIKCNETLKDMDFITVYSTIIELLKDGKAVFDDNVQISEQQSEQQ